MNFLSISLASAGIRPELQVIVMTRHVDPRFGENSYKLTNINRSEPARELFEVPAGLHRERRANRLDMEKAPASHRKR